MGQLPVHCLKWTFVPHFKSTNDWEDDIYESMSVRFITEVQRGQIQRTWISENFYGVANFYSSNKPPQFCTNNCDQFIHVRVPCDTWHLVIASSSTDLFNKSTIFSQQIHRRCLFALHRCCCVSRIWSFSSGIVFCKELAAWTWNVCQHRFGMQQCMICQAHPSAVYHDQPALQYQHLPTVAMSMSWCHGAKEMPLRTPWNSWWHGWIAC